MFSCLIESPRLAFLSGLLCLNTGGYVIGTTSTKEKATKAKACGADEVILYSNQDFVQEVNRITEGTGVNVIYDGVGKTTFYKGKLWIKWGCGHCSENNGKELVKVKPEKELSANEFKFRARQIFSPLQAIFSQLLLVLYEVHWYY